MRRPDLALLTALCLVLGFEGLGAAAEKPKPPFELAAPAVPSKAFGQHDLSKLESGRLGATAGQFRQDGKFAQAVQLQHWSLANGEGDEGIYNLACYYSLAGNVDASLYWLQVAAVKEGVDSKWAGEDADLANLRQDKRWPKVRDYLQAFEAYWEGSGHSETTLVVPKGYDGKQPIPVLVGLHGFGSRSKRFVDKNYQSLANELNIALVGVSATIPRGPTSFVWSEDPQRDAAQIDRAFRELGERLKPAEGKIMLFGFSQGAMMGLEIAARNPARYAGVLAMSPGGENDPRTGALKPQADHQRQGYIITVGAKEAAGNVAMARLYAKQLKRLSQRVDFKEYPDVERHTFPPDYSERLKGWIEYMLNAKGSAP